MGALLAIALAAAIQGDPLDAGGAAAFYGSVDVQRYVSVVSRQDLDVSPRWRAEDDAPPLPPRAAIDAATEVMSPFSVNGVVWRVGRVTLQPVLASDRWIYVVEFARDPHADSSAGPTLFSGPASVMAVVVLMDGRAVVPTPIWQ